MSTYCQPARITDWHEKETDAWRQSNISERYIDRIFTKAIATAVMRRVVEESAGKALEIAFISQADKWDQETRHLSSPTQRMMHPSYQAILGMARGNERRMIRLLISDMQKSHRPWFSALSYITKENPIERVDAGKMDRMIEAWVGWGRDKGLL
jgi:hypothetical protein